MSSRVARQPAAGPGERALSALEALLALQQQAMVAGDLPALEGSHARIHAMLSDPEWRRDAARARSQLRLRAAIKTAAINAGLAARGEAQAARSLAALGIAPDLYNATGGLSARGARSRGLSA
jgi:hypothetical protein